MANDFFSSVKKVSLKQEQEKEIIKESKIEPQNADREISIDLLVDYIDSDGVGNDYVFGPVTDDSISNLAKGIEEVGFKTAVEVWELSGEDSGKFMIYSGHRRVAAMKYLKKEKVKCDVYPYPKNEIDRRLQFLRANIHSRGSIKASAEGGDIYIAHQIKYLENILRKQGIKSQAQIDNIVCDEFNAKKNTVWKYKSLLKACDELIEAEREGVILIEQAASICSYDKDSQKIIVKAIMDAVKNGHKLLGKDVDNLLKQLHSTDDFDKSYDDSIRQAKISSLIAALFSASPNEEKDPPVKTDEKKNLTLFDKYSSKFSAFRKTIQSNQLDDLKPKEINSLMAEYNDIRLILENAYIFAELMAGKYKGVEVFADTKIDDNDLMRLNPGQLKKLAIAYDKAGNLDNIVNQISTIQAQKI